MGEDEINSDFTREGINFKLRHMTPEQAFEYLDKMAATKHDLKKDIVEGLKLELKEKREVLINKYLLEKKTPKIFEILIRQGFTKTQASTIIAERYSTLGSNDLSFSKLSADIYFALKEYEKAANEFIKAKEYVHAGNAYIYAKQYMPAGINYRKGGAHKLAGHAFMKAEMYAQAGTEYADANEYKLAGDAYMEEANAYTSKTEPELISRAYKRAEKAYTTANEPKLAKKAAELSFSHTP